MQQAITTTGQHTTVVIDCASARSEIAEALVSWIANSPRGNHINVRLPSRDPHHSPALRRVVSKLLTLGCSVTCLRRPPPIVDIVS